MTQDQIDEMILAQCREQWLKVARVLASTVNALEGSITHDAAADRLAALVAGGRLEAQGDIAKWRRGEVRLPPKQGYWSRFECSEESRMERGLAEEFIRELALADNIYSAWKT